MTEHRWKLNELASPNSSAEATRPGPLDLAKAEPEYTGSPSASSKPALPVNRGIGGLWEGQYRCQDEGIGFSLHITKRQGADIAAVFEFFALPNSLSFPRGTFNMSGRYDPVDGKISLESGDWIKRPLGFERHDMEGQVGANGSKIIGRILTTGCAEFILTRR